MTPLAQLMVAPNGARKSKIDHPALPISIDEIVATAIECHDAGAEGLHLHVRDGNGHHTLDVGLYRDALAALGHAVPSMVVQITTESVGLYTAAQQRAVVMQLNPKAVSVALSEMLEGGDASNACMFYKHCTTEDIAVQHILYGAPDLSAMSDLLKNGRLERDGLQLLFVLGRHSQHQQSAPEDLDLFVEWLKQNCPTADWAVCAFGKRETECLVAAHHKGGKVRVGFENSFLNADGTIAASNAQRVCEMNDLLSRT